MNDISSSSAFVDAGTYNAEWTDVKQLQHRSHNVLYTGCRYGRRFLLKGLTDEAVRLSDYRLAQEKEFLLGISVSHPHIATTYALEEISGIGRCIVQEFIDGGTLTEWLATKPSVRARERVLDQLLDALDYLHQRQLVHHDLKSGNILVTRHGHNLKLIDFGLSDTDDSLSPLENDPQADIKAVGRLFSSLLPGRYLLIARKCRQGKYTDISALRRSLQRRRHLLRALPLLIAGILMAAAATLFFVSHQTQPVEQKRYEGMQALVETYTAQEREDLQKHVNLPVSFDSKNVKDYEAYKEFSDEYFLIRNHYWLIRDSLMATYSDTDPLRETLFQIWMRKETDMDKELYPKVVDKMRF